MLKGKHIILGITGSIAAFKAPLLVRLLVKAGAEVKVVMTPVAMDFVTPLTLATLSQNPVYCRPFDPGSGSWNSHVDLGRWADLMVIAPVTANTLAKMANGQADNLLVATYLSAKCPVYFAPAMDLDMYKHPSTTRNIETLVGFGNHLIEPAVGELASGLSGAGRMEEPDQIFQVITKALKKKSRLEGLKVLVTAGPTYEPIDPVRFIGNFSSGLMGTSIAEECFFRGADVTLVAGPVHLDSNPGIKRVDVLTAEEMYTACINEWSGSQVAVMAAAVADFTPLNPAKHKIKKTDKSTTEVRLKQTTDILKALGSLKQNKQVLVGFALETENELENAIQKLHSKNLDLIVLNSLREQGAGFGTLTNKVSILYADGKKKDFALKSKAEVATDIADAIELLLKGK